MRPRAAVVLAMLLAACEHSAPFRPGVYGPDGPLSPGSFTRITFNPGEDRWPTWLPGDAGILYAAERRDRADRDRCFATQPPGGGAITRYACATPAADDSLNVFESPAFGPGGRIAYVRVSSIRFPFPPLGPQAQALVVATLDDPNEALVLRPIPYTAPWGRTHEAVSHVGWVDGTRLVYLAEQVRYPRACSNCPIDTVRTGLEIVVLDFGGATPVTALVPGTDSATSVAVGATGDTIYYTIAGDGRVFRRSLSSGDTGVVHDFGSGRNARDARVVGGRLVAVVDGSGAAGGDLHVVDLATGADALAPTIAGGASVWYSRPAVSADGRRVVAQTTAYEIILIVQGPDVVTADTVVIDGTDLWLYTIP